MLSFRAWLALLLFYLMYLLLGGYIFYLIEEPNDCINVQKNYNKSQELNQLVEDIRNGKKKPFFPLHFAIIKFPLIKIWCCSLQLYFDLLGSQAIVWCILESGIDLGQGINVGSGKFDKNNKHMALNKRRAWEIWQKYLKISVAHGNISNI